jgi:hypothetical protein
MYENSTKNKWFITLIYLKTIKNAFFNKKLLVKTYIKDIFRGIDEFFKQFLHKALWSYTCSKFWELYMPPAAQIKVNDNAEICSKIRV